MNPAQIFATPSLMMLMGMIGGAMREGVPVHVVMKLLLIGTLVPDIGAVLRAWLIMEEQFGDDVPWSTRPEADQDDAEDDDGAARSGWISQSGPVWRWRHVTAGGIALVVLTRWLFVYGSSERLTRRRVWQPAGPMLVARLSQIRDERLGLDAAPNCALFVPLS